MNWNDIVLALMKLDRHDVTVDKIEGDIIYFSDHTCYFIKKVLDNKYVK